MTKEEAETLKPGDIISCAGNGYRTLTKVWIEDPDLCWNQKGNGNTKHQYELVNIDIVSRYEPPVINNYQIY